MQLLSRRASPGKADPWSCGWTARGYRASTHCSLKEPASAYLSVTRDRPPALGQHREAEGR